MGWKRIKLTLEEIGRVYPKVFMIILISKKIDYDPKKFSVCSLLRYLLLFIWQDIVFYIILHQRSYFYVMHRNKRYTFHPGWTLCVVVILSTELDNLPSFFPLSLAIRKVNSYVVSVDMTFIVCFQVIYSFS